MGVFPLVQSSLPLQKRQISNEWATKVKGMFGYPSAKAEGNIFFLLSYQNIHIIQISKNYEKTICESMCCDLYAVKVSGVKG